MNKKLRFPLCLALLLGLIPSSVTAGVSVIGSTVLEKTMSTGTKADGQIAVHNSDSVARDVRIFATDYSFTADGQTTFASPAGQAPRSNASWITFTPHQLTLPPGETMNVDINIQAPSGSPLSGTYWSVLMVEPVAPDSLEPSKAGPGQVAVGLRSVVRYAVQVVTHIADTGRRTLRFTNRQLVASGDQRFLQMDVENTGERGLRPTFWAQLFDAKGVSLGKFDGGQWRIYPGCSTRVRMDLSKVPHGLLTALIVADNGDSSVFGSQCKLNLQ